MAEKTYVVTGPGAIVTTVDNTAVLVPNGSPIPSNAAPAAVEHLLAVDLIAEAEPAGGLAPIVTGDGEVLTHPADPDIVPTESESDGPPAKSASKGEWVDFAVSQGADRDEAEASTKDELIDAYGAD